MRLVVVALDVRAGRPRDDDVPRVSEHAQDVPQVVPAPVRRHVLDGEHGVRVLRARRLRVLLARRAGAEVPAVPRVLDDVRGVRPVVLEL